MLKRAQALFLRCLGAVLASAAAGVVNAESATRQLNMPRGVTEVSQAAYDIHMIMMWICTVIGVASVWLHVLRDVRSPQSSRGGTAELISTKTFNG